MLYIVETTKWSAGLAQLVAQLICNHQVAGSSPAAGSIFLFYCMQDLSVKNSFFRTWNCCKADFSPILPELLSGGLKKCKVIYRTRHKECFLVSPEVSGLSYPVVFKRYAEKRFFRYFLRPSLAYREYLGFKLTAEAGIPAAEVVALGEKRCFVKLEEAFFVTRYLEGYRDGAEFCHSGCDEKLKDDFIRQNLSYLAKLHCAGLVHGCFHPRNEMWRMVENGKMDIVWIDLASVVPESKSRRFSRKGDLLRFLKEFGLSEAKEAEYRAFYRQEISKY